MKLITVILGVVNLGLGVYSQIMYFNSPDYIILVES